MMHLGVPIRPGAQFRYNGEILTIVEIMPTLFGNCVSVEGSSGRTYFIALRELLASGRATFLGDDVEPNLAAADEPASVILANLDERGRHDVDRKACHVREVLTGFKSGSAELALDGEPRAEYSPVRPYGERYEAKAAELGVDKRTVQRWVSQYQQYGEAGLAASHRCEQFRGTDHRWIAAARHVMVEHVRESKPTRRNIVLLTNARVQETHGAGVVPLPSRATAYRVLGALERQVPLFRLSAKRNRETAERPSKAYGALHPTRPGEYLLMDTTRLDVFAMDPVTLKWVNLELTVSIDWYSRCICGLRLTPMSTKSIDVASVLFQSFRPFKAPDNWPREAVWPEHGIPRVGFVDVNALTGEDKFGLCNPAVVPETIVVDHGKPFRSMHISSVCQRMGISVQPARLRTGRDKGVVERFFRTIREDLLQNLPGYKGPDVYSRGADPGADAFYYIDELEDKIRQWVACNYHHYPHRSLIDPKVPGLEMTPAQMFQHGIERAGFIEVPRDPDLAFQFLKPIRRQILHDGVSYKGRMYNGPALDGYRNVESDYVGAGQRRWYLHVNPDDVRWIYFQNPATKKWDPVEWKHAPALDMPCNEDAVLFARRLAVARNRPDDPAAALSALLADWHIRLGDTLAERRIALRMSRQRASLLGDLDRPTRSGRAPILDVSQPDSEETAEEDDTYDDIDDLIDSNDDQDYYGDAFEDE